MHAEPATPHAMPGIRPAKPFLWHLQGLQRGGDRGVEPRVAVLETSTEASPVTADAISVDGEARARAAVGRASQTRFHWHTRRPLSAQRSRHVRTVGSQLRAVCLRDPHTEPAGPRPCRARTRL